MILTNCNKTEQVVCGCTPAFSSYVNNSFSVLDVGTLIGGSCTFTDYVIDWYVNGVKMLVSGTIGSSPDVQAFHPFTGSAAIPVPAGDWVPVIRWVISGGQKIFPSPTSCGKWCATLTGLPTITVQALNCMSSNTTGDVLYQYKLSYSTTQDYSLASRLVNWSLQSDTRWVGVKFEGLNVADKIEIFKNEQTSPMTAWIVGTNYNTNQAATMPYNIGLSQTKFVLDISTYTPGDYLKIKVTPSVLESNPNTIWNASFKCLNPSTADFASECAMFTQDMQTVDVSTIYMVQETGNCRWMCYGTLRTPAPYIYGTNMYKYGNFGVVGANSYTNEYYTTGKFGVSLPYGKSANPQNEFSGNLGCANISSTINLNRVGNVLTFTFTDASIYNEYKSRYQLMMASSWAMNWVNDPADINYYRYGYMMWRKAVSCGDTGSSVFLYFHITSNVTFNDPSTLFTIDVANPSMTFACDPTCDSRCSTINNYVGQVTNTQNLSATWLGDTNVKAINQFQGLKFSTINNQTTQQFGYVMFYGPDKSMSCYPPRTCSEIGSTLYKVWVVFKWFVKITDYGDPAGNFEVWDGMDPSTGCQTGGSSTTYLLKYRKVNGIQTYP